MSNDSVSLALKRQQDRPDIHKPFTRTQRGEHSGLDETVYEMVHDLKNHVPSLSIRQLSTLVGVSKTFVSKVLDNSTELVEWSTDDNEAASAAHLSLLRQTFPDRHYEDDTDNEFNEVSTGLLLAINAPLFHDVARKADQSHTIKRPITLATVPYQVAA